MADERIEVSREIAAAPEEIFRLLCDPQGHVAIDSSGMLMAASGDVVRGVGDRFVVHMDGSALDGFPLSTYDVSIDIVEFVPDSLIAWTVIGPLQPPIGHTYGYALSAGEAATLVTAYYDWSTMHPEWRARAVMPILDASCLRATLGILARTVARRDG
jgi:hypothetical protein